jgi:hypothetical protein
VIVLYLALLAGGVSLFVLSYVAPWRIAVRMRQQYPQQWQIIAEPEQGRPSVVRTWLRLQQVLRSPALAALEDPRIDGWRRVWRYSPWLGWLGWLIALAMRLLLH